jgi:hypothetical protein
LGGFGDILKYYLVLIIFIFWGCLGTSHRFFRARPQPAGQSSWSLGVGSWYHFKDRCPDQEGFYRGPLSVQGSSSGDSGVFDGSWCEYLESIDDTVYVDSLPLEVLKKKTLSYSLSYRLGVLDSFFVFTGLEFSLLFQYPSNPVAAEYELNIGLPALPHYFHSLGGGVQGGSWSDFSWFFTYSAARDWRRYTLYSSFRMMRTATQNMSGGLEQMTAFEMSDAPGWSFQLFSGISAELPEMSFLPKRLHVQAVRTWGRPSSLYDSLHYQVDIPSFWNLNAGLEW